MTHYIIINHSYLSNRLVIVRASKPPRTFSLLLLGECLSIAYQIDFFHSQVKRESIESSLKSDFFSIRKLRERVRAGKSQSEQARVGLFATNKVKFAQRFTEEHGLVPADTGNRQRFLQEQLLHKRRQQRRLQREQRIQAKQQKHLNELKKGTKGQPAPLHGTVVPCSEVPAAQILEEWERATPATE